MYSSNNILNNGNNLISYPNQPFSFESNQTSKDETNNSPFPLPPLSFFQFPYSPFEDNEIFLQQHDFLLHQHQNHHHQNLQLEEVVNVNTEETSKNIHNNNNNNVSPPSSGKKAGAAREQIPRKRSSKKDRHSKISTARGLRDRRMRLSLEVAKRFFGLQDMLGFEKASKTVEWLLNQAKLEIKQLAREKNSTTTTKSATSTSECEGVSSLDEVVVSGNQEEKKVVKRSRRGNNKVTRKSSFNPISREKARERARERTREKLKTKKLASVVDDKSNSKQCNNGKNHSHNLSWNPFETVEESEHHNHSKEHSEWSPTMMFNSLNNPGILQHHQFAQFQSFEKPWEDYNRN